MLSMHFALADTHRISCFPASQLADIARDRLDRIFEFDGRLNHTVALVLCALGDERRCLRDEPCVDNERHSDGMPGENNGPTSLFP
jgi:hypothetical protein